MKKKIILLSSTLIIIFAGLFLYQRFINVGPSGPSSGPESKSPLLRDNSRSDAKVRTVELSQNIGVGETENLVLVRTNKKGRVILKYGFVERMESLPGKLKIRRPWIQIFSKDDRVTEITAQTGTVDVEGDEGQMQIPNSGFLENVRIKMYSLPKDTAVIPNPLSGEIPKGQIVEMEVQIYDTVRFEREISHLQSAGDCTVSSKLFGVEGTGLSLTYDQNNERLQDLKLQQVKQLRLSRKNLKSTEIQPSAEDPQPIISTEDRIDSDKSKAATYQFILSKNVVIEQPAKNEKLLADRIKVIADFDPNQYKPESREISPEQEERETNPIQFNREPAQEKKKDIYIITCDGPLKIALAPEFEPTPLADRMMFTATGKPAQIWKNGKLALEADIIKHDQTKQFSELSGSDDRPVRMSLSAQQRATAQRMVTLDLNRNLASLYGPGLVEYITDPNTEPAKIHYRDELLVKFTALSDSLTEAKAKEPAYVEWISFKGPFEAESKDGRVQAQKKGKLDFYIPPPTPTPKTATAQKPKSDVGAGPIKYLELWGNVIARDQQSSIQVTDHLEAAFDYIDPNTSRIRSVHAFGPLRAEDPNYIIEAQDKLELTFETKTPAEKTKPAQTKAKAQKTQPAWGFDQLLSSSNLLHAIAEGADGALRFTSKQDKYQVIGDRAEGDALKQWTITGQPAQVIGLAGQGRLEGNKITADLINKICRVAGQGNMDAVMKGDLLGRESNRPMPMHFEWKDGVTYNLKDGKIIAEDVNARIESVEKTKQITWLQCPTVTIEFDPNSSSDRPGELYTKLDMETFQAHGGQVQVRRQEYDPNTNRLLNDLELLSQQLHFDNQNRIVRAAGPGLVEVTDYRPRQSGKKNPQDQSVNQVLTGMFGSSGPARTLLRFGREMRFDKEPNELRFTGDVALDHLPLSKDLKPDPAQLANLPGLRKLDCRELILILADSNTKITKQSQFSQEPKAGNDKKLRKAGENDGETKANLSGLQQAFGAVHRVTALGRVFAEANFADGTRRFFAGQKLTYDSHTKEFVIEGTDAVPAYLDQMQFRTVRWNHETGRIEAIPLGQSILAGQF